MITVGELRRWLDRSSRSFAAVYLALGPLLLIGPVGAAAALVYLVTGDVRGGRLTAVGLLLYGATNTAVGILGVRRSGRVLHVLLGVLLVIPLRWVDSFLNSDRTNWRLPGFALLLLAGLLYNLVRFTRKERRRPVADDVGAPVPTP